MCLAPERRCAGADDLQRGAAQQMNTLSLLIPLIALLLLGCDTSTPSPPPQASAPPTPPDASPAPLPPPDTSPAPPPDASTVAEQTQRVFISEIRDKKTFEAFSKTIATEKFTKFFIDLRTDEVIFFDVAVFPMHTDAVYKLFFDDKKTPETIARFEKNYLLEKEDFLMGYIVHHRGLDVWTFSFWEGDRVTAAHVRRMYERLREQFFMGSSLAFRPDSTNHESVAKGLEGIPTMTNDQIYKARRYHPFNRGEGVGRLRILRATEEFATVDPGDILILSAPIPDLGVVAGVISEKFSSPLSHVALRARARRIPYAGFKEASTHFAALEGHVVFFKVTKDKMTLRPATQAETTTWHARRGPGPQLSLRSDLSARRLAPLDDLTREHAPGYGAKAALLGVVAEESDENDDIFSVPPGFGIPIFYYHEHLRRHGIDRLIRALLDDIPRDPAQRAAALAELRGAIQRATIDPRLLREAVKKSRALTKHSAHGVFVRSSTNAEDLPEFSGAGLYDTVANVPASPEPLSRAIRQVWASVWNLRAFNERAHFGIDHAQVFAAVLVQQGINADTAGVMVTKNIYDTSNHELFTISANHGLGLRTVEGRRVPEQLLYDPFEESLKVISRSDDPTRLIFAAEGGLREVPNPRRGEAVLSDAKADLLGRAGVAIKQRFGADVVLDIEWLFEGDQLHIVQARPLVE